METKTKDGKQRALAAEIVRNGLPRMKRMAYADGFFLIVSAGNLFAAPPECPLWLRAVAAATAALAAADLAAKIRIVRRGHRVLERAEKRR